MVQEEAAWYRKPVPIRNPQPLSQGLTALPAPLTQGSQALRGTGIPYYSGFAEIFAYRPGGECRCNGPSGPRRECGVGRRKPARAGDQSRFNETGPPQNLFCGERPPPVCPGEAL